MFYVSEAKPGHSRISSIEAGTEVVPEAAQVSSETKEPNVEAIELEAIPGPSKPTGEAIELEAIPGPSNSALPKKSGKEEDKDRPADISVEGKWMSYTDLMSDSYPAKSKLVYLKAYKLFERFLKSKNQWTPNVAPTDLQVLNYFYHLRHELKFAPTTLWSIYARINAVFKRLYGISLNSYKRVSDVLKSYESGHIVKQAGIFTPQQIEDFVTDPELASKYWLVRKVVCLIGYFGGFRNIELKSLKFENCELDEMGYWFRFARSKQRGRLEPTSICVPRRQPDWIPVKSDSSRIGLDFDPASVIDLYLSEVQNDLQCSREELEGDFFRATHGMKGQKFTKLTLGKNMIGKVGVQVATELCLPRPESFTGHCWRRSCGTSASDSGVNVTTLMAMMGWSNPKTAMVYVKKSRMTSLSLALYLANVQRTNLSNPFPRYPPDKRPGMNPTEGSKIVSKTKSEVDSTSFEVVLEKSEAGLSLEDDEMMQGTQELIREIEIEELNGGCNFSVESGSDVLSSSNAKEMVAEKKSSSGSVDLANQLSLVDPRMGGFLQNLQNSGNITININFDKK